MKRKPDILTILIIVFGLGAVTTGYTQSLIGDQQVNVPVAQSGLLEVEFQPR